jgi:hypothetical protein
MPWPPTTDQILDLAEGGVYMRADRYRFDLEDAHHHLIGELTPDLDQRPTLTHDTTRSIFRSVRNLRLPSSETTAINTLRDRVRIWMVLQNGAELPLGRYVWADDTHPLREWGVEKHSVLTDQQEILDQQQGRSSYSRKGWNLVTRAYQFAISPSAGQFPADEIDFVSSSAVAAQPLNWTGTDRTLAIINEHLALAGYFPAYFNNDARLIFRPIPDQLDDLEPTVSYRRGGRVVADSRTQSDDLLHAPNVFFVTDTSASGTPILGRYDVPDSAPHSAVNRDREVRDVQTVQGAGSASGAITMARNSAMLSRKNTFDWQTWTSPNDARHDTFTICAIDGLNYIEVAWEMELTPTGLMTHQARRPFWSTPRPGFFAR